MNTHSTRTIYESLSKNHLSTGVCLCVASVLRCVAVCCGVLQCVVVCCRVLQCVRLSKNHSTASIDILAVSICISTCIYLYFTEPRRERRWARRELAPFYPSTLLDGGVRLCHMCARTLWHCSVLQCVAVCCSVLQRVTDGGVRLCHMCARTLLHCSVLQCVAVCCSVLQFVAVCCSVLQRVTDGGVRVCHMCARTLLHCSVLQCVAVCYSVLQCVAVCCSQMTEHA